jgi:hypothetical protein
MLEVVWEQTAEENTYLDLSRANKHKEAENDVIWNFINCPNVYQLDHMLGH